MAEDLKRRIQDDVESAMRARDRERLGALRLISAAIKQREVDERIALDSPGVIAVLERMIKQRRDSLGHFESAGREDLAARESFGISVIEHYMPARLSPEERGALLDAALAGTGVIFLALSGYALTTRKDFSFMGGFLVTGLLVVFGAILVNLFVAIPALSLAIAAIGMLIFSGFILYDTSRMVHGGETNYIHATIGLYVSILNIFQFLLMFLGMSSDD